MGSATCRFRRRRPGRAPGSAAPARPGGGAPPSCVTPGEISIGGAPRTRRSFQRVIPGEQPRNPYHDTDTCKTDNELKQWAARQLDPDEMAGKGQEHTQTEDL